MRRRPLNLTQVAVGCIAVVLFAACLIAVVIVGIWAFQAALEVGP